MKALVITLTLGMVASTAGAFEPVTDEFVVNTHTEGAQWFPAVAVGPDGAFVVGWEDASGLDGAGVGVFARRYDAAGRAIGPPFQVNEEGAGHQANVAVASFPDGGFIIAWQDDPTFECVRIRKFKPGTGHPRAGQTLAFPLLDTNIRARIYDRGGHPGPVFQVNVRQAGFLRGPVIAVDGGGDFVVAWRSQPVPAAFENAFVVDTIECADLADPAIGPGENAIWARRFRRDGTPLAMGPADGRTTADFRVNEDDGTRFKFYTPVAMAPDGRFVIGWMTFGGADGSGAGVFGKRFDAGGVPLDPPADVQRTAIGREFQISTRSQGLQGAPGLGMAADGSFMAVWVSDDGSQRGIFAKRFDAAGNEVPPPPDLRAGEGNEWQVNDRSEGRQIRPTLGMAADGSPVVAWSDVGQDGSVDGVFAKVYTRDLDEVPPPPELAGTGTGNEFRVNQVTAGQQSPREGMPLGMNDQGHFLIPWNNWSQSAGVVGSEVGVSARLFHLRGRGDRPDRASWVDDKNH